jgi:hypothetical protein
MLWPGERIIRRIMREGRHDRLLLRLHKAGQSAVHAGLTHYAQGKNYHPGWVRHSFREIFGQEPPRHHHTDPNAPLVVIDLIIEWATTCKRKPPGKRRAA